MVSHQTMEILKKRAKITWRKYRPCTGPFEKCAPHQMLSYQSLSESLLVDSPTFMSKIITVMRTESMVTTWRQNTVEKNQYLKHEEAEDIKSMTKIIFFKICKVMQHEFFPECQTTNTQFSCNNFKYLMVWLFCKKLEL